MGLLLGSGIGDLGAAPPPPGEAVTSLSLTNTVASARNDQVVLFGHAFARGDVPSGATLGAEVNSVSAPLQTMRTATWPDGSLKFGVFAAVAGDFTASQTKTLALSTGGSAPSGSNIALSDLPADGVSNADLTLGAETITCNRTNLQAAGGELVNIFTGPHCAQWVYRPNYTNVARVRAAFHITAFRVASSGAVDSVEYSGGNECVDIRIDEADHGTVASSLHRFRVNGATVYSETAVMYQYTRWHRWESLPDIHVIHNHAYLDTTGLVLPVRSGFTIPSGALNWYQTETSAGYTPNDGINETRGWRFDMSIGGGDEGDIGPVPAWDQAYRVAASGTDGADWREQVWLRSEGGGRHQMHYWDEDEGRPAQIGPGTGQWSTGGVNMNPEFNNYSGRWGTFPRAPWTDTNGITTDISHQPRFGYTQYLLFGRYFFLEEQQYWAAMVCGNNDGAYSSSTKYNIWVWDQVRAEGWGTLAVACGAVLAPDGDAMRSYFEAAMSRNIEEAWDENYAPGQVAHNPCGGIVNRYPAERSTLLGQDNWLVSWQSDFVNIANVWCWMMGYDGTDASAPDYTEYSAFTSKWPVGRVHKLGAQNTALYWIDLSVGANSPPSSWSELRENLYLYNTTVSEAFRGDADSNEYNAGRNNTTVTNEEPDTAAWRAGFASMGTTESVGDTFEPAGDQAISIASLACAVLRGVEGASDAWTAFNALTLATNNGSTEDPPYSGRSPAQAQFDLRITSAFPQGNMLNDGPGDWIQTNITQGSTWGNQTSNLGQNTTVDSQVGGSYSGGGCGNGFLYIFGTGHNNGMSDSITVLDLRRFDTVGWREEIISTADHQGVADTNYSAIGTYLNGIYDDTDVVGGVRDSRGAVALGRHTYDGCEVDENGDFWMYHGVLPYDNPGQPSNPWAVSETDLWKYTRGVGYEYLGQRTASYVSIPTGGFCIDTLDSDRVWCRDGNGLYPFNLTNNTFGASVTNSGNFGDESFMQFNEDTGTEGSIASGGSFGGSTWNEYNIATDTWSSNRAFPTGANTTTSFIFYVPARHGSNYGTYFCYGANQGTLWRWNGSSWTSIATGGPVPNDYIYGRAGFDEVHQVFYAVVYSSGWQTWLVRPYAYE